MKKISKKPLFLALLAILLLALVVGTLEKLHVINLYSRNTTPSQEIPEAKTTSTAPSAQDNFTSGSDRTATSTTKSEGTVKDTSGSVGAVPEASQWTKSSDGAITVYAPIKSALVTNGFAFSGESSHPKVYFRLIDDVSGVIAQGPVKVSSGKYSGTFSFTTKGTQGRLDVFYANDDGVESSSISIPVRYK